MPLATNNRQDIGSALEFISSIIVPFKSVNSALTRLRASQKAAERTPLTVADILYAANHYNDSDVVKTISDVITSSANLAYNSENNEFYNIGTNGYSDTDKGHTEFNDKNAKTSGAAARRAIGNFFNWFKRNGISGDRIKDALVTMATVGAHAPNGIAPQDSVSSTNETVEYLESIKGIRRIAKYEMEHELAIFGSDKKKVTDSDAYLYMINDIIKNMDVTTTEKIAKGVDNNGKPVEEEVTHVNDVFMSIMGKLKSRYATKTSKGEYLTGSEASEYAPMDIYDDSHSILGAQVTANCFVPVFIVDVNNIGEQGTNAYKASIMIIHQLLSSVDTNSFSSSVDNSFDESRIDEMTKAINLFTSDISNQAKVVNSTRNDLLDMYESQAQSLIAKTIAVLGVPDKAQKDFAANIDTYVKRRFFCCTAQSKESVYSGTQIFNKASGLYTVNGVNDISREKMTEVASGNMNWNFKEVGARGTVINDTEKDYTVEFNDTNTTRTFSKYDESGNKVDSSQNFIKDNLVVRKDTDGSYKVYCLWAGIVVFDKVTGEGFANEMYQNEETRAARLKNIETMRNVAGQESEMGNAGIIDMQSFKRFSSEQQEETCQEALSELISMVNFDEVQTYIMALAEITAGELNKISESNYARRYPEIFNAYDSIISDGNYWFNTAHPDMPVEAVGKQVKELMETTYGTDDPESGENKFLRMLNSSIDALFAEDGPIAHLSSLMYPIINSIDITFNGNTIKRKSKGVVGLRNYITELCNNYINRLMQMKDASSTAYNAYQRIKEVANSIDGETTDARLKLSPNATKYDYGSGVPQPSDFVDEQEKALHDLTASNEPDYAKISNEMPKNFDKFDISKHKVFGKSMPGYGMQFVKCGGGVNVYDDLVNSDMLSNRGLSVSNMETLATALDDSHHIITELEANNEDNTIIVMEHTGVNALYKLIDIMYPILGEPAGSKCNARNWAENAQNVLNDAKRQTESLVANGILVPVREKVLDVLNDISLVKYKTDADGKPVTGADGKPVVVANIADVSTILSNVVLYLYNYIGGVTAPGKVGNVDMTNSNAQYSSNDMLDVFARTRPAYKNGSTRGHSSVEQLRANAQYQNAVTNSIADDPNLVKDLNSLYNAYGRANTEGDSNALDPFSAIQKAANNKSMRMSADAIRASYATNDFASNFCSKIIADEKMGTGYSECRAMIDAVKAGQTVETNVTMHDGIDVNANGDLNINDTIDIGYDKNGSETTVGEKLTMSNIIALLDLNDEFDLGKGDITSYYEYAADKFNDPVHIIVAATRLKMAMTVLNKDKEFGKMERDNPQFYHALTELYAQYAMRIEGTSNFVPYINLIVTLDAYTLNMAHEIEVRSGAKRIGAIHKLGEQRANEIAANELLGTNETEAKTILDRVTRDSNSDASDAVNEIIDALTNIFDTNKAQTSERTIANIINPKNAKVVIDEFKSVCPNGGNTSKAELANKAERYVATSLNRTSTLKNALTVAFNGSGSNVVYDKNAREATKGHLPLSGKNIADSGMFSKLQQSAKNVIKELPLGVINNKDAEEFGKALRLLNIREVHSFMHVFNNMCSNALDVISKIKGDDALKSDIETLKTHIQTLQSKMTPENASKHARIQQLIAEDNAQIKKLSEQDNKQREDAINDSKLPKPIKEYLSGIIDTKIPTVDDIKEIVAEFLSKQRATYEPEMLKYLQGAPSQITVANTNLSDAEADKILSDLSAMQSGIRHVDYRSYIMPGDASRTPAPFREAKQRLRSAIDEFEERTGKKFNPADRSMLQEFAQDFSVLAKPIVNYKSTSGVISAIIEKLLCGIVGGHRGRGASFMMEKGLGESIKKNVRLDLGVANEDSTPITDIRGTCDVIIRKSAITQPVVDAMQKIVFPSRQDGSLASMTSKNVNWNAELEEFKKYTMEYMAQRHNEANVNNMFDNVDKAKYSHLYDIYATVKESIESAINAIIKDFAKYYAETKNIPAEYPDAKTDGKKFGRRIYLTNIQMNNASAPGTGNAVPTTNAYQTSNTPSANTQYPVKTDDNGQISIDFDNGFDDDDDDDDIMPEVHGADE